MWRHHHEKAYITCWFCITCEILEYLVYVILFMTKESFYAKFVTLVSGPLERTLILQMTNQGLEWSTKIDQFMVITHCVKSSRIRSYSGPHFPALGLNTDRYSVSLRIQSQCGEIRTRITPTMDTFRAVTLNIIMNLEMYPHCHFHFFG